MGNPSTIWGQLSTPYSASGSIPYVDSDGVTITTDVQNFFYDPIKHQLNITNQLVLSYAVIPVGGVSIVNNNTSGRVVVSAGQSYITVSNNKITANTIVLHTLETADATATTVKVTAVNSTLLTFTFTMNTNATGNTILAFVLVN